MSTAYGNFHNFCRDTGSIHATLPVCNLFAGSPSRDGTGFGGCDLEGISLGGGRNLANLGTSHTQAAIMREDIADKIARFNTVCRSRNPDRGIPHYALEYEASCCWTTVSYAQTLNHDKKIANSHNPTEKCSCSS